LIALESHVSLIGFETTIEQRNGQIVKALGILHEMKAEGVKPGVFVFTCMIQTCIQAGMIDQAIEMFKKMFAENIQPDNVTYYTII
jgi:pentatricopeptide repeat protein